MEQPREPDGCSRLRDRPRDVEVTVIRAPQRQVARARLAGVVPVRAVITLVLLAAAVAAVLSSARGGRVDRAARPVAAVQFPAGDTVREPAIAAAYRYPLGCLGASLSGGAPASVSGGIGRAGPCWRYGVFLTAVLHRVARGWQLGLEAVSRRCPRVSLPAALRLQLVACRR